MLKMNKFKWFIYLYEFEGSKNMLLKKSISKF